MWKTCTGSALMPLKAALGIDLLGTLHNSIFRWSQEPMGLFVLQKCLVGASTNWSLQCCGPTLSPGQVNGASCLWDSFAPLWVGIILANSLFGCVWSKKLCPLIIMPGAYSMFYGILQECKCLVLSPGSYRLERQNSQNPEIGCICRQ